MENVKKWVLDKESSLATHGGIHCFEMKSTIFLCYFGEGREVLKFNAY